jgi:RNA polymerase sigma-70 factor, ECF subfamily
MPFTDRLEVTRLLQRWSDGDEASLKKLIPLLDSELHRLAQGYMRQERPNHTLQPTALVNELYVRLVHWKEARWENRAHFIGVAAKLMRRILVDHARRRGKLKRGGGAFQISLAEVTGVAPGGNADLVFLDEALKKLAEMDPQKSEIVELRFFGGLSVDETAEVLKISSRTVKRAWSLAQAWLYRELRGGPQNDA